MTTNQNNKKKPSAARKLIPAVGMLTASAMMLASSTYAWFTMSREVEVTGIKMTATVPEDLQISLGEINGGNASTNLAAGNGFLTSASDVVTAPANQDDDDPYDWSNTAAISTYYDFGKLIPAGSTDGVNVFFTPDSAGVGRTMKSVATAYSAATGLTADTTNTDSGNATAHVKTANGETTWAGGGSGNYVTASAWNVTNDDGYYIDIPVWLRTSSTTAPTIYVTGYIKDGINDASAADTDGDELYKAVRVAILTDAGAATSGCIDLAGFASNATATYPANLVGANSLIDSAIANANFSLSGTKALSNGGAMAAGLYGDTEINTAATGKEIGTLQAKGTTDNSASATAQYGPSKKFWIRVWLEGDDTNCWNANAGQDWEIALKFMTSPLTAAQQGGGNG